jgi:valyl-tRNA synthetase
VLAESLRLLHPLLSFVTEEIYSKLPNVQGPLITAPYPVFARERDDPEAEKRFGFLQEFVRAIRTLRSECTVPPEKKIRVLARIREAEDFVFLNNNEPLVKLFAGIGEFDTIRVPAGAASLSAGGEKPAGSIGLAGSGFEAFVYIAEAVDMKLLKQKFGKELEKDRKFIDGLKSRLANENFIKNAPPELVEGERRKLEESIARSSKIESWLEEMERL